MNIILYIFIIQGTNNLFRSTYSDQLIPINLFQKMSPITLIVDCGNDPNANDFNIFKLINKIYKTIVVV